MTDVARLSALRPDGPDEMGREMAEGPAAVEGSLEEVERLEAEIESVLTPSTRVVIVGTGASLAMARIAEPAWRQAGRIIVVRQSTEAALGIDGHTFRADDAVVAISQSGGSPETVSAARLARSSGCRVLALTAGPSSELARLGDVAVVTPSGHEDGAATKSELAALSVLFAMIGALPTHSDARRSIGASLETTVTDWEAAARLGPVLAAAERTWLVGLGMGGAIAGAAGLLWHEKVHRPAFPTTVSEFRHGPVEAAGPDDAVVLVDVDPGSAARQLYLDLLRSELGAIGTALVEVSPLASGGSAGVRVAADAGPLAALEALLRMQQLARATAHAAGTYQDGFRILRAIVGAAPPFM